MQSDSDTDLTSNQEMNCTENAQFGFVTGAAWVKHAGGSTKGDRPLGLGIVSCTLGHRTDFALWELEG